MIRIPFVKQPILIYRFRREGEELPKGYGVAYYNHASNMAVCTIIPFHLVLRAWHWFQYWWLRRVKAVDWVHTPFDSAYRAGKREGERDALAVEIAKEIIKHRGVQNEPESN